MNNLNFSILLPLLFFCTQVLAQDKVEPKSSFTVRQVSTMVVFPGCESIDPADKPALQKCLQQGLTKRISEKLVGFQEQMEAKGIYEAITKIQFVISNEGKIIHINSMGDGGSGLGQASVVAMEKIANEILPIQPAELEDGSKVNLIFQLPIRFVITKFEQKTDPTANLSYKEILISTLKAETETYEVRINKEDEKIKVYEVSKGKDLFLGNFNSPTELMDIEPYKSIILALGDRNLITEANLDGKFYRFYTSNSQPNMIFQYQLVKGEELLENTMSREDFIKNPKFLELIVK